MNGQRRGSRLVVLACSVALVASGCGDDSSPKKKQAAAPLTDQTFTQPNVPFTFRYPGDFNAVAADQLPKGFVAILGIDPINFIDVRVTARTALRAARLPGIIAAGLKAQGVKVTASQRTRLAGRALFTFIVASKAGSTPTTSRLSFFTAQGRTWEIGCQSNAAGRQRMDAACRQALASFSLHG